MIKLVISAIAVGLVAYFSFFYGRPSSDGLTISEPARICAQDFAGAPHDQVDKRCACVIEALQRNDEGREVLKLIIANKQFLKTIESAASHTSVLDAMNTCGH